MEEAILDFRDLWKIIKRRKWIIVSITLLCIVLGVIVSSISKKSAIVETKEELYKSTASVIIGAFSDTKIDNIKDITTLNRQIVKNYGAIASSRTVAEKTIKELNLDVKTDKFMNNIKVDVNAEALIVAITYGNKEEKDVEKVTDTYSKIFMEEAKKIYPESKLKVLDVPSKPEKIAKEDFDKISMPQNPNQPNQPAVTENKGKSRKLMLAISAFLGLMIGFGAALVIEYMDNSIRKREEAEAILDMPVIGEIKKDKEKVNESYKILRTTLQYINKDSNLLEIQDKQPKNNVFMITSPSKDNDKTTVSVNLAISFTEAGFKTLIMDANGRNPMVHTMLGLENENGLSNMLAGETINIQKCNKSNLSVLSWGNSNVNPADAFVKGNMNQILKKLKEEFDYLVIDTPSIVDYADAGILSKMVDEVVMVISEDKTDRDEAFSAKKFVDTIGIKVSGICWIKDV